MDGLVLVIGNKNYSSWSLRAWLALKQLDVPFNEFRIPLDTHAWQRGYDHGARCDAGMDAVRGERVRGYPPFRGPRLRKPCRSAHP